MAAPLLDLTTFRPNWITHSADWVPLGRWFLQLMIDRLRRLQSQDNLLRKSSRLIEPRILLPIKDNSARGSLPTRIWSHHHFVVYQLRNMYLAPEWIWFEKAEDPERISLGEFKKVQSQKNRADFSLISLTVWSRSVWIYPNRSAYFLLKQPNSNLHNRKKVFQQLAHANSSSGGPGVYLFFRSDSVQSVAPNDRSHRERNPKDWE